MKYKIILLVINTATLFSPYISRAITPPSSAFVSSLQNSHALLMAYFEGAATNKQLSTKQEKKEFYYDRIIVHSQDKNNQPLLLFLEAGRQERGSLTFDHVYKARLLYQGKTYNGSINFTSSSSDILSDTRLLTSFSHTSSQVLPTHTYEFTVQFKDKKFHIKLDDLNSDFLVKNSLSHMRFVSSGNAQIKIGEELLEGNSMVDSILSNNGLVPTLAGYEVLRTSHSATLWDEDANFYHFDLSEVYSKNIPYESHKWILFKEKKDGAVKKLYDARLAFDNKSKDFDWVVVVPGLNNKKFNFKLSVPFNKSRNNADGFVEGWVEENGKEKKIRGYVRFVDVR